MEIRITKMYPKLAAMLKLKQHLPNHTLERDETMLGGIGTTWKFILMLYISQQFFSHVGMFFCLPGLNQY